MDDGEFSKDPLALRGDADPDLAVVRGVAASDREAQPGEPVGQLDDAVVAELELPGEGADGRGRPFREALDGQEELVLLGLEARLPRGLLAEREEPPDQVPEPRQGAIVRVAKVAGPRRHSQKVYRNTIYCQADLRKGRLGERQVGPCEKRSTVKP
jgi:hypothetical protein